MITIEFKDFEDMMGFARNLVSTVETNTPTAPPPVQRPTQINFAPAQQPAPTTPPSVTPPVQQAAPVLQTAPVTPPLAQQTPIQTAAPSYTADDLARAAMTLMDSGRQGDLINLLARFGTDALTHLPQEQYGAFATALRGLGAPI